LRHVCGFTSADLIMLAGQA